MSERWEARRASWVLVVGAVVLLGALVVSLLVVMNDDEQGGGTDPKPTATSTVSPTATGTATTAGTTTSVPPVDTATAVWPYPRSPVRYRDPVEAARGFATEFAGFVDPIVNEFQAGDSRSGEVEVRAFATGPVTTVFVRQLGADDAWWVLGSASANIVVERPAAGTAITSPLAVAGRSRAFEAQVDVEVRQDGGVTLGRGYVMGGGEENLRPFSGSISFAKPTAKYGALLLTTASAKDGSILEASVMRLRLGGSGTPAGTQVGACFVPAPRTPATQEMVVTVFYTCSLDGVTSVPVPVKRVVDKDPAVLRAAVHTLLAGPTSAERSAGIGSWFSSKTAGATASVVLRGDGTAVVDFSPDLREAIPGASTSAGSQLLLSQLDATVFQFASVKAVEYRLGGTCDAFFQWLQMSCHVRTR